MRPQPNPRKIKQLGFAGLENQKMQKHFGGAYLKNSNAKAKRPITTKRPMHLVMRSTLAVGSLSLLKRRAAIEKLIQGQGKLHGVKIYRTANAGNHLHLVILPRSRDAFNGFVRSISGLIARVTLNSNRGSASTFKRKFWDKRPFTRVLEWGREYTGVCKYLLQNTLEALGFIQYTTRNSRLLPLRTNWSPG